MSFAEKLGLLSELRTALAGLDGAQSPAEWIRQLIGRQLDELPLPGCGSTLQRWQALCLTAERDLSLAKRYEGHTDAIAIQAEIASSMVPLKGDSWGMWASESPHCQVLIEGTDNGRVLLNGCKSWCSGAADVSHGLLTAWYPDGRGPQLVRVAMGQAGLTVSASEWCAVGMADSASLNVRFHGVAADCVGEVGAYLSRAGFWQGGAGIAACWYGGALRLAESLQRALQGASPCRRSAFQLAALGKVDVSLKSTAALLREAAHWIDNHPTHDAAEVALRVRLAAEGTARVVLNEVSRALGATPFCRDARLAKAAADLPIFILQSHGERDFASLGECAALREDRAWAL